MLLLIGASSNGRGLLSGVPSVEVLETVVGGHAAASLGFVAILALNLLVGATPFSLFYGIVNFPNIRVSVWLKGSILVAGVLGYMA